MPASAGVATDRRIIIMATVQVSIQHRPALTVTPTSASVAAYIRLDLAASEGDVTLSNIVIGWYGDCWSMFRRVGATDFDAQEWIKRTFKTPAKALEQAIIDIDSKFEPSRKRYKNVKGVLAKAAYAGLSLETVSKDAQGNETLRYKTETELRKELKEAGVKESTSDMIERLCKALVPADVNGIAKLTVQDYIKAGDSMTHDQRDTVDAALLALAYVVGPMVLLQVADSAAIELRNGKVTIDDDSASE